MRWTIYLLAILCIIDVHAEVSITSTGEVFRLSIPTGQVAMISYHWTDANGWDNPQLIARGETNELQIDIFNAHGPQLALAGPAELVKTNLGNRLISYQLLSSSPIISSIVTDHSPPISIAVPTGKTIRILAPIPTFSFDFGLLVSLAKDGKTINPSLVGGEEFDGPINVSISKAYYPTNAAVVSYYITEKAFVSPQLGVIQGPTGSFEIDVEKTVDLTNWFPAVVHRTSDDQKAFYRLRITR